MPQLVMRKPSRTVRCRAGFSADVQISGGIGMRSICKAAIRVGSARTGSLGWFKCSLASAFGGWQRSCSAREGGKGRRGRKMSPNAAVGSALFSSCSGCLAA
ncbi:hypothetical protein V8C35DRAFT_202366 [Trichoderma chlorosporum]